VRLVIGDGRNAVQFAKEPYDVIVSQPSNLWISGMSNLFTREFFAMASQRLTPDGVFCQWVQAYRMPLDDFRSILRTFFEVFSRRLASGRSSRGRTTSCWGRRRGADDRSSVCGASDPHVGARAGASSSTTSLVPGQWPVSWATSSRPAIAGADSGRFGGQLLTDDPRSSIE
jgi:spermidine synthase